MRLVAPGTEACGIARGVLAPRFGRRVPLGNLSSLSSLLLRKKAESFWKRDFVPSFLLGRTIDSGPPSLVTDGWPRHQQRSHLQVHRWLSTLAGWELSAVAGAGADTPASSAPSACASCRNMGTDVLISSAIAQRGGWSAPKAQTRPLWRWSARRPRACAFRLHAAHHGRREGWPCSYGARRGHADRCHSSSPRTMSLAAAGAVAACGRASILEMATLFTSNAFRRSGILARGRGNHDRSSARWNDASADFHLPSAAWSAPLL